MFVCVCVCVFVSVCPRLCPDRVCTRISMTIPCNNPSDVIGSTFSWLAGVGVGGQQQHDLNNVRYNSERKREKHDD